MLSEKRKEWLRVYRLKNRRELYLYRRKYYKKNKFLKPCFLRRDRVKTAKPFDELHPKAKLGIRYEKEALNVLKGSTKANSDNKSLAWDIEWKGKKIDVKARNRSRNGDWAIIHERRDFKIDYLLVFCLDNDEVVKTLLIPTKCTKGSLTIGRESKFDRFIVRP